MQVGCLVALAVVTLVACDNKPAKSNLPRQPSTPRVEATLTLPNGDGRLHIVAMPTEYLEVTRCLVAVGPNGQAAVSCTPKDLDLPVPDQP